MVRFQSPPWERRKRAERRTRAPHPASGRLRPWKGKTIVELTRVIAQYFKELGRPAIARGHTQAHKGRRSYRSPCRKGWDNGTLSLRSGLSERPSWEGKRFPSLGSRPRRTPETRLDILQALRKIQSLVQKVEMDMEVVASL